MDNDLKTAWQRLLDEQQDQVGAYLDAIANGCTETSLRAIRVLLRVTAADVEAVAALLATRRHPGP